MMPSKDMPGLDSEQAKKLHVALQKLIDSDLPLAHKEVGDCDV